MRFNPYEFSYADRDGVHIDTLHPMRQFWMDHAFSNGYPKPEECGDSGEVAIDAWNAAIKAVVESLKIEESNCHTLLICHNLQDAINAAESLEYVPQTKTL